MRKGIVMLVIALVTFAMGCSQTMYESKPDKTKTEKPVMKPDMMQKKAADKVTPHTIKANEIGKEVICTVMKVPCTVDENTPALEYKGKVYYFCCNNCPKMFMEDPDKYAVKTEVTPHAITADEIGKEVTCPVMKVPCTVDKNTSALEYKGKVYYFCCNNCPKRFMEDPDKYAAQSEIKAHFISDEEVGKEVRCTVMGGTFKVEKDTPALEYKGKVYYFCCYNCPEKFKENPDKYAIESQVKAHFISDEEIGKEVICPVMKGTFTVDKETPALEYKGKVYYFCCYNCPKKFIADPDKYASKD
ncbi:MAG: YHS domain-containing protein [Planctomycetes bacterium]|nr:YHS domain-containing protein [Planctomycetota bacterium]